MNSILVTSANPSDREDSLHQGPTHTTNKVWAIWISSWVYRGSQGNKKAWYVEYDM